MLLSHLFHGGNALGPIHYICSLTDSLSVVVLNYLYNISVSYKTTIIFHLL